MAGSPELLGHLLLGGALAFGAAIQPGPLQAFLVSRVAARGWARTLPASFAPLLSDGPIAVVSVLVLGRVPATAQHVLRAGGGLLLLYLAVRALREWRQPRAPSQASVPRTLAEAAMVNLLNPNPYLGWALVLGPAVVGAWNRRPVYAVAFVTAFYATMVATLAGFVFLVGAVNALDRSRQRTIAGASALLLAALGVILLIEGAHGVWVDATVR
jgi:threonine/homoserine/homoserine lactone efflux protein